MPDWQKKGLKAPEVCSLLTQHSCQDLSAKQSRSKRLIDQAICLHQPVHACATLHSMAYMKCLILLLQKKVERKAYEDKGVVPVDQALDDPVEEKLRKQK